VPRRSFDLLLLSLVSAYAIVVTLAGVNVGILRAVAGIPLVLFAPGYAIISAIFPEPAAEKPAWLGPRSRGVAERIALSLGLSLAIAALAGLVLNLTPWGLKASSWALVLGLMTIGACAAALARRKSHRPSAAIRVAVPPRQAALLGMAAAIVVVAGTVAWLGAERQSHAPYTQFWVVRLGASAFDIGIGNHESGNRSYIVTVKTTWGASVQLSKFEPKVRRGATWTVHVAVTRHTGTLDITANLYYATRPTIRIHHVYSHLGARKVVPSTHSTVKR
jgi:uncharacterized membrane protein